MKLKSDLACRFLIFEYVPNPRIHTLYLDSNFMNEKGWNSDKKYVFGTENKNLSMEFMLTKLYNLQACILLVRPV